MDGNELKARVSDLISQARTKQAMDLLWEHAPALQNDLLQLKSRFNDNERRNRMGLLGRSDYSVENNRIVAALLSLVNDLGQNSSNIAGHAGGGSGKNNSPGMIQKILFLASNPAGSVRLQLGKEIREIRSSLSRGKHRDQFKLDQHFAVRVRDLKWALLDDTPQILHFAGHGFSSQKEADDFISALPNRGARRTPKNHEDSSLQLGIVLEDDESETGMVEVSNQSLAGLFRLFKDDIQCVFLNACYSAAQAKAINEHIQYVIGYNAPISDQAAIDFAASFYDAVAAGRDIPFAFEFAVASLGLDNMAKEGAKAVLLSRDA